MPVKMGEKKKSQPAWQCPEACVGAMIQWDTKMQESTLNNVHRHMQFDALLSFHTQLFYLTLNTIGTVIMNRFIYKTPSTQD